MDLARDPTDVLLEGLHAVKHALRFGAVLRWAVTYDLPSLMTLAAELAPDLISDLAAVITIVERPIFDGLADRRPGSPLLAVAVRPAADLAAVLVAGDLPVVAVHEPRHPGNVGAVVRVAAAAGARAVLVTGPMDVWSPAVVRAAAGLHWAVDVASVTWPLDTARPVIAFDPDGDAYDPSALPRGAVMLFGGERHGLPDEVLRDSAAVVRLPMRAGVSSLNLATSVAAALYTWRLA